MLGINIEYTKDLSGITENMLAGFFVGWPNPPNAATHLKILQSSHCAFVAIDKDCDRAVGFITAVSDGVLAAYLPLLEVIPDYQDKGIGSRLVKLMLDELGDIYMIDICHDAGLAPFYAQLGAHGGCSSLFRNFSVQSGVKIIESV